MTNYSHNQPSKTLWILTNAIKTKNSFDNKLQKIDLENYTRDPTKVIETHSIHKGQEKKERNKKEEVD